MCCVCVPPETLSGGLHSDVVFAFALAQHPTACQAPGSSVFGVRRWEEPTADSFSVGTHRSPMECDIHPLMMMARPLWGALPVPWRPAGHASLLANGSAKFSGLGLHIKLLFLAPLSFLSPDVWSRCCFSPKLLTLGSEGEIVP